MHRREFLSRAALTAGAWVAFPDNSRAAVDGALFIAVQGEERLGAIAPDFLGLGYEISSVAVPGLLSRSNSTYVELVRTLGAHGVIRVGGNTSDYSRYSAAGPAISKPKGTVIDEAALSGLGGFLNATGWKLIWGLNLGNGSPADAIAEAKAVVNAAGEHLLAFEIGNEPDLFSHEGHRASNYSYNAWLADYRRYKSMLREQIPGIRFAGPDVAGKTDWVTRFAADEGKDIVLLTHHYYREGQNEGSTIAKLLGPDAKLVPQLTALKAASLAAGVPYRICEVNSFSGGGRPGVSDTMAAALWVLDYLFTLATYGCGGVNLETGVNQLGFVSSYSPIGDNEHDHYAATPEYYGMLAFSLAGTGQLVKTEIGTSSEEIKAYAVQQARGTMAVTVINKSDTAVPLRVKVSGGKTRGGAALVRLTAPRIDAHDGVSLGEAQVSAGGKWKASKRENIAGRDGAFDFTIPAASAAILSIST